MPNHPGKPLVPREGTLRKELIIFAIAGIALIALYLLRSFATALILMFAGVLFGIFLHGTAMLVSQRLHLSFRWSLALVFGVLLAVCIGFIILAGPLLVHQVQLLAEQLPQSVQLIRSRMECHEWGQTILTVLPSVQSPKVSPAAALGSVSHIFIVATELLGALVFIVFVGQIVSAMLFGIIGIIPFQGKLGSFPREVTRRFSLANRFRSTFVFGAE